MPVSYAFTTPGDEPAFHPGRAASSVGAAQRASLGRGLCFALLLAASSLAAIYLPSMLGGPDWVEGGAAPSRGVAPASAPTATR